MHITGTAADPTAVLLDVVAYNSQDAAGLGLSRVDAAVSTRATQASVDTIDDFLDTEVAAILAAVDTEVAGIKAKTDNLPASPAAVGSAMTLAADAITSATIAAGAITSSEAPALANLDAAVSTRLATAGYTAPANSDITAIKAKTDNLPADPADESLLEAAIATRAASGDAMTLTSAAVDAILDEAVEGTMTFRQAIRVVLAVLAGKASGAPTGPLVYRDVNDTKNRVSGAVDTYGNRTSVTIDVS